jgi:hypothetical protein
VIFGQDAFEEGRFTCTEKAGEDCDGDHFVQTARGIHERINFKNGKGASGTGPSLDFKARRDYSTAHAKGQTF